MEINIFKQKRLKNFQHQIFSKSEDVIFSIIEKLPDRLTPQFLANWMKKYLDKRLRQLQYENTRITWQTLALQNVVDEIHRKQQDHISNI